MGILKGLKSINDHNKKIEDRKREIESRVSVKWFKLEDGQSVKVRFLQELDEDAKNYSAKNGIGFIAVEHTVPSDYRRKAVCTADESSCFACDKSRTAEAKEERSAWRQKTKLYVNVLVDDGMNEPYVAVLSQGTGPKSITPTLIDFAIESDSITNRIFKVKRTGAGFNDTSYSIIPFDPSELPSVESYEIFDLDKIVRRVPLEEQAAFYTGASAEPVEVEAPAPADIW